MHGDAGQTSVQVRVWLFEILAGVFVSQPSNIGVKIMLIYLSVRLSRFVTAAVSNSFVVFTFGMMDYRHEAAFRFKRKWSVF